MNRVSSDIHAVLIAAFWCLIGMAVPRDLSAQKLPPVLGNHQLDVWRAQDGVRLAFTSNLVQTRDGYLWLSSQSGLTRFDGVRFRVFDGTNTPALRGRPNLQTYPLVEDADGVLWIGSDIGLFARTRDSVVSPAPSASFATDLVNNAVLDSAGRVWAITRLGRLFRVSRGHGLQAEPGTRMRSLGSKLTVDASGDLWIAAGIEGAYRVHHDSVSAVEFPAAAQLRDVTGIIAAPDSSIWFGTSTAIVQWKHGRFRRIEMPRQVQSRGAVSCFAIGSDGALWIGTEGAGLYRFDGRRLDHVSRANGLSDDRVIDIMVDRDHNIWIATRDGLNRLRAVPFAVLTQRTGLPTDLPGAIVHDRSGAVWLAPPTGGLFRKRAATTDDHFEQVPEVSTSDLVTALVLGRNENLWVGQRNGSVRHSVGGRMSARPVVVGLPPITDLAEDSDGTLWIGTWHGLYRLRNRQQHTYGAVDGLPDDAIHRILRDARGTLWVATGAGVSRTEANDSRFTVVPVPGDGASRAAVLFESPAGTVWVGSEHGLARVAGGRISLITTAHGLPENWVGASEPDAAGNLWLGQIGGLTRVRLADLIAVADGRAPALTAVSGYQSLDGLPGGDPTAWPHPWSLHDSNGKLWFAMGHGIAVVDPAYAVDVVHRPITHLEEVLIDGNSVDLTPTITINPTTRRVEFRYTGVDLSNGPGVQFRYRLEGFDTAWVDAGTQRAVSYTKLDAGRYRFRVTSRASNGQWTTTDVATEIEVLAPLYRRTWFLSVVFFTLLVSLWIAHRAVLRTRLMAMHDERSRMAREIHDSLLQGFGGIGLQLHAASARLALPPERQSLLDRILVLIDTTMAEARGVVWDLRLPDIAARDFSAACADAAQRILAGSGIEFRVIRRGRTRRLSSAAYVEVLRIVEEAFTNCRKHAEATEVLLEFDYRWSGLRLTVQDNGKGADANQLRRPAGHWGVIGMRERARRVGARLSLNGLRGNGMTVSVEIGYAQGVFTRPEPAERQE